jgi:hypothetical protein
MAVLVPGQALTQPGAQLLVENRLAAGQVRFRLVVIDDAGTESAPADIVVTVTAPVVQPAPPVTGTATLSTNPARIATVLQKPQVVKLPPGLATHIFTPKP